MTAAARVFGSPSLRNQSDIYLQIINMAVFDVCVVVVVVVVIVLFWGFSARWFFRFNTSCAFIAATSFLFWVFKPAELALGVVAAA